ncbi:MlaD family protein [Patulibacter medicamentivorans]|uniref:MlaD family protein n=1 Tax=Patulibacter medicamentivorans TaxID=1097667 RepID=UPI0002F8571A|nr:MlaD family protein [Patulibacter medicamentivorans]
MTRPSNSGRRPAVRRRNPDAPHRVLLRGGLVLAIAGLLAWIALSAYNGVPGRSYTTIYVSAPQIGNLLPHDAVRIGGVRVGQVQRRETAPDGGARLELQLEDGIQLPADTRVRIRANGLLGARYVQLLPGRSDRMLRADATIRGGDDTITYGVPEALDTFDRETRGALGVTVRELGKGLAGRGRDVNRMLPAFGDAQPGFQQLVRTALARPGAVSRLLPSLDRLMTPLDESRDDVVALLRPTGDALMPLVDRRDALQRTLDQAPATLTAATHGLQRGTRLLSAARRLTVAAHGTLPDAPRGLRATTALLRESPRPLRKASILLDAAKPAVPAAIDVTTALNPLLPRLDGALGDALPMVRRIGRYGCDIINLGTVFRSMTGYGGMGQGPAGPPMAFRLQAIISPGTESIGVSDPTGFLIKDGYPKPCKYLGGTYPAISVHGLLRRKAR